jgi:hypothetical protein
MIILSPYPKLQFIDNNAIPMANCLLYTYEAGTDTPLATFTDSTGIAQNSNPIILDAGGRANVWIDSNTAYKYVLKNLDGSILFTVDNINSLGGSVTVNVDTIAALRLVTTANMTVGMANVAGYYVANDGGGGTFFFSASSVLADDGGMIIAPTSGPGRWLREAPDVEINALWYGAHTDGVTNSTPSMQSANTFAASKSWNLFLPSGTYFLATNPGFTVNVRFAPYAVLKFSNFTLPINPVIADVSLQHFICQSTALVNFGTSLTRVYPEWFGAKGDGSMSSNAHGTDDTTAIQKTLDSCTVGSWVIFNTTKKYWCNTVSPKPGTGISGSQPFEAEDTGISPSHTNEFLANIQYISTGANLIDVSNSNFGGLRGVIIKDLILDGNNQAQHVVNLQTCGSIVDECTIRNAQTGIGFGGNTNVSDKNRISNCNVRNCTTKGISNSGSQSINGFISNVAFSNCVKDIDLSTQTGWTVNNVLRSNGQIDNFEYGMQNYNINVLGAATNDTTLVESTGGWGDNSGTFTNATNVWRRIYLQRKAGDTTSNGVRVHDALTNDDEQNVPGTTTRAWYGRDIVDGSHHFGDQAIEYAAISNAPITTDPSGVLSVANLNFGSGAVQFSSLKSLVCDVGTRHYQVNNNLVSFSIFASNSQQEIKPWYRGSPNNVPESLATTATITRAVGQQTITVPPAQKFQAGDYICFATTTKTTFIALPFWFNNTHLWGIVISYDSGTGVLVVNIKAGSTTGGTIVNAWILGALPWYPSLSYSTVFHDDVTGGAAEIFLSPVNLSWSEIHGIPLQTISFLANPAM